MSTWRRHRAHRNSRASSIAPPGGEGWTIRDHRAILRSEPYASADLGAASDVTAKSIQSEAAPVSPTPAISPQRHSAVIAPAHGDGTPDRQHRVQVGSTSWAGSPGRFSACSVALRRSRQDLICTIYPHFPVATNTRPSSLGHLDVLATNSGDLFGPGAVRHLAARGAGPSSPRYCRECHEVRCPGVRMGGVGRSTGKSTRLRDSVS